MDKVVVVIGSIALPVKYMIGVIFLLPFLKQRPGFLLRMLLCGGGILAICIHVGGWFTSQSMAFTYNGAVCVFLVLGMFFCFQGSAISLLFCSCMILCVQQTVFNLIIAIYLGADFFLIENSWIELLWNLIQFAATILAYCFMRFFYLPKIDFDERKIQEKKEVLAIFLLLFCSIFVCHQFILEMDLVIDGKIYMFIYIIEAIACFFAMGYLFGIFNRSRLDQELEIMMQIMKEREQMYESSRGNIEIINRKYHDLKYMLNAFADKAGILELREISDAVNIYGSAPRTGCAALDVILAENNLRFTEADIDFTCSVDGELLSFLRDTDIYALFGNLMSNALEATTGISDENRYIKLFVGKAETGEFLRITEENGYEGEVVLKEGKPETKKTDKDYHGFGTKSIAYIAEKYGGGVSFSATDGKFRVSVVIPLPRDAG